MELLRRMKASAQSTIARYSANGWPQHKGLKGGSREAAVKEFLVEFLPEYYGIGAGEVWNENDERSHELDVIIYDRIHSERYKIEEGKHILLAEGVYGVIEVKSILNTKELISACDNIKSLFSVSREPSSPWDLTPRSRLNINPGHGIHISGGDNKLNHYFGCIVAFKGLKMETVEKTMEKNLQGKQGDQRIGFPEAIFNIEEGYSVVKFGYSGHGTVEVGFKPVEFSGYVGIRTNEYTLPLFAAMTWEFGRKIRLKQREHGRVMEEIIREGEQVALRASGLMEKNTNPDLSKSKLLREILEAKVRVGLIDRSVAALALRGH